MKSLETIRRQLTQGEFECSRHAFKRAGERNNSELEIRQAGAQAQIMEDYSDDKYSPTCSLLGFTAEERPIRLQVSYIESDLMKVTTLYEPDQEEWINFSQRRGR